MNFIQTSGLVWTFFFTIFFITNKSVFGDQDCFQLNVTITQKIQNSGFHREVKWLIETHSLDKESWVNSFCNMVIRLDFSPGMYVNPDQVADLKRVGKLDILINGTIDTEAPAHEASKHIVYLFLNNSDIDKISLMLPIHLRYQRSQITGGFGKVQFTKATLLASCNKYNKICGKDLRVNAPANSSAIIPLKVWKNITYQHVFEDVELLVPVGDLEHYPFVAIITLVLGCAGCIYVLSMLTSTVPSLTP